MIAYLSQNGDPETAREQLAFAARQARSDPDRFVSATAAMAQRVMTASGDTESAERLASVVAEGRPTDSLEALVLIDTWLLER